MTAQFHRSRFIAAIFAFAAVTALAANLRLWAAAPEQFPYKTWTAWSIEDFLKLKQAPDVVFLGSSLVLVPVGGVDADFLHQRVDGTQHHNSLYFEKAFAEKSGIHATTFNFALPGEMPSDACLIANFLLTGKRAPHVIVYGVGPRDFMDNLLPSPASTDPYRFLSRFGDVSQWASQMMPDWVERCNYELGKRVYFYGNKTDIATTFIDQVGGAMQRLVPASTKPELTADQLHELLPEYHPFAVKPGEAFFRPLTADEKSKFTDNLDEYKKRYRTLKMDTFNTQMHLFDETLAAARRNGSQAVVAAMPITDLNRQLLSDESWNLYRTTLRQVAEKNQACLVDFNSDPEFKRSDFCDTVHLHAGGGRRWMDKLIDRLAANQTILSSLASNQHGLAVKGKGGAI